MGAMPELEDGLKPATARRPIDVLTFAVGILLLVTTMVVTSKPLSQVEVSVFRGLNDLPDALRPVIWPLMQYGTIVTVPILCLVALAFRRYRLALAIAFAGIGVYLLARVVKLMVERGRPGALLDGVHMREVFGAGSLGYPSGHAAVAAALACTCAAYLGGWWLRATLLLAIVVPIGRLYVGAHLPLDVIGGAALGLMAGSLANLVLGVLGEPERRTDRAEVS